MKLQLLVLALLVGGAPAQTTHELPPINVAAVFHDCEETAITIYPVLQVLNSKPEPTVQCKLTDIIRCEEQEIRKEMEIDPNEKLRKSQVMECLRSKLQ